MSRYQVSVLTRLNPCRNTKHTFYYKVHLYCGIRYMTSMVDHHTTIHTNQYQQCINFSLGQPTNTTLPIEQITKSFNNTISYKYLNYGLEAGELDTRQLLCRWQSCIHHQCTKYHTQQHNTKCQHTQYTTEQMTLCGGVSHGIDLVVSALCQANDVVFIESPSYFLTFNIFTQRHCKLHSVPVNTLNTDTMYDFEALEADIIKHKPKLFYTIPIHHNPTGRCASTADKQQLLQLAEKYSFVILSDEVYYSLTYDNQHRASYAQVGYDTQNTDINPHIAVVSSVSKTLAPAMRFGWILANKQNTQLIQQNGVGLSGSAMCQFSTGVVHDMLQHDTLHHNIDSINTIYRKQADTLMQCIDKYLPQCTYVPVNGGYFLYLILPYKQNSNITADQLSILCKHQYNVLIKPAIQCMPDPEHCTDWKHADAVNPKYCARLCLSRLTCNEIADGVERLATAFQHLYKSSYN